MTCTMYKIQNIPKWEVKLVSRQFFPETMAVTFSCIFPEIAPHLEITKCFQWKMGLKVVSLKKKKKVIIFPSVSYLYILVVLCQLFNPLFCLW